MVKTNWEYSQETEAHRIIHTAKSISTGFFRINGFELVASSEDALRPNQVIFPDLPYIKIPRFWQKIHATNIHMLPLKLDKALSKALKGILPNETFSEPNYSRLKTAWDAGSEEILSTLYRIIPTYKNVIQELTIYPTNYGTVGSFNSMYKDNNHLKVYLRVDRPLCELVRLMILAITRPDVFDKYKGMWNESQLLGEWLILETELKDVIKKYDDFNDEDLLIAAADSYVMPSDYSPDFAFYEKLGVPLPKKGFYVSDSNSIMFDNIELQHLTPTEKELLSFLISNKHDIVSVDAIADILFTNDSDFSLYAISKTIQRVRDSLEINGISGSYIKTVRNKGYTIQI